MDGSADERMNILIVHRYFPGQFTHLARRLACEGHAVTGIGNRAHAESTPGVRCLFYDLDESRLAMSNPYTGHLEIQTQRGLIVHAMCLRLRESGFNPDLILCHPGWGEGLFLKDVFPDSPLVAYCEYFYRARNSDLDFDPEFPPSPDAAVMLRMQNACNLLSLAAADAGICPTHWQKSVFPREYGTKIKVIHDGVDTDAVKPDPRASFRIPGSSLALDGSMEVVTYATRSLEPYRGFHTFMRAAPLILEARPRCHILVVGKNEPTYGRRAPGNGGYRDLYLRETGLVSPRIHFMDFLPFPEYLKALQVSSVHVYLTYPFVLSWSLLEAMAAGCLVAASDTAPVREFIEHGVNGFLTDFFDPAQLARTVVGCLEHRAALGPVREEARKAIAGKYDLTRRTLPAQLRLLSKTMETFARGGAS